MDKKYFELNNGVYIPAIGFGTGIAKGVSHQPKTILKRFVKETAKNILVPGFRKGNKYKLSTDLKKDRSLKKVSKIAAEYGCELFDTARAYQYSESYLKEALFEGKNAYNREDLFIITKTTNWAQRNGKIMEEFETSLNNLGTDYIDLYLLHWPQTGTYLEAWKVLETIYKSGRAKAIGVCNSHIHHLEKIKEVSEIKPMVNELECHPLLQQWEIREYCKNNGIQLIAHTPTGKMKKIMTHSSVMNQIASKYGVGVSQVVLRWHYQLGDVSIPNTTNPKHAIQNLKIWDFELSDEDMMQIKQLDCGERIWPDPDNCDFKLL